MLSTDDLEASIGFLDGIGALGCNSFDTAPVYGNGQAERVLGAWMDRRGNREQCLYFEQGRPSQCGPPSGDGVRRGVRSV